MTSFVYIFVAILVFFINLSNQQIVQLELNELKEKHADFANYLLNQTKNDSTSEYEETIVLNRTTSSPPHGRLTTELIFTSTPRRRVYQTPPTDSASNRFLYFNNETNSFEGVSMQSTYSTVSLTKGKTLALVTTSAEILPSTTTTTTTTTKIIDKMAKSILPLYPQFVYTIKFQHLAEQIDLVNLLNDQTIESSKLRLNLIKSLTSLLNLNQTDLKLNWIDKLTKNSSMLSSTASYSNEQTSNSDYLNLYNDYSPSWSSSSSVELDVDSVPEPEFVAESSELANPAAKTHDETVLISFSSSHLYDIQRAYLDTLKQTPSVHKAKINRHNQILNELRSKFEQECERFFTYLVRKHDSLKFKFKFSLLKLLNGSSGSEEEHPRKVQFLKLCDLNKIYTLFKNKQYDEANTYVKNSTKEIVFNVVRLEGDYYSGGTSGEENSSGELMLEYGYTSDELMEKTPAKSKLIKHKSQLMSNGTYESSNQTSGVNNQLDSDEVEIRSSWFWRLVPDENFLLAVVVPVIVVVSLFVLSIAVACLLHMLNKDYRQRIKTQQKKNISLSNTTESTASHTTATMEKHPPPSSSSHTNTSKSSNPIYKQKAYLSKGVPVILYEEMSDKPLEDYDENNVDVIGGTGRSSNYRSPFIMRFEKPPVPAPPEYSRESLLRKKNSSGCEDDSATNVLNELKNMLNKDVSSIINLTEYGGDDLPVASDLKSSSSSVSPAQLDSDDNVQLLYSKKSTVAAAAPSKKNPMSMQTNGSSKSKAHDASKQEQQQKLLP